ncbi:MAG: hypothetical protein IAE77_18060 [Prosthecobacter sp.]|jgi:hypothetical protein|uniref:hypothetical protein n=1 Tax=Prosthecobacter sp. TaxID=1965333 RepID=UPI001A0C9F1A|nr:hypothetical protein [Prosthecobacter sp.]MBE2285371.1 hypothetical protein [Prosthecobacter sp.]
MIEVEIYAPGVRSEAAMMQLRNQMDHFPRVRYKVDARHDLVYFEIDRPGDINQQEIDQIFDAIDLQARFVGQIPEELRSGQTSKLS